MVFDRQQGRAGRRAPDEHEWLTLGQAAAYLGVAQSTIRKWADQGKLPTFKTPGKHRRFKRADLDDFLSGSQEPSRRPRPLVLIVDDDDRLREFVRLSLDAEGFAVREAATAEDGLAVIEDEMPDLILLDVMMPRMDGWQMLQRVQERHGVGAVPVIMFSGKVEGEDVLAASQRGAQAFIGKPFDPQELIESTKQLLRT